MENQQPPLSPDPPQPTPNQTPEQKPVSILPIILIFLTIFLLLIGIIASFYFFIILPKIKLAKQSEPQRTQQAFASPSPGDKSQKTTVDYSYQAKYFFDDGKYQEQLDAANKGLLVAKNDNEKAILYYWKGLAEYKLNQPQEAQNDLETSLKLSPNSAGPYVTLSAIEMDKANFQKALEFAQKCAELDPKYAWCENNIGMSLYYLGQKAEGIKHMEKAVSLAPDSFVFRDNLNRAKQSPN